MELTLTKDEKVTVNVFDVQGKEALQTIETNLTVGSQDIHINTSSLVNGVYFVKVTVGSVSTKMKLAIAH
jgi:hypothetical protein